MMPTTHSQPVTATLPEPGADYRGRLAAWQVRWAAHDRLMQRRMFALATFVGLIVSVAIVCALIAS
jgi:hypothetical protein